MDSRGCSLPSPKPPDTFRLCSSIAARTGAIFMKFGRAPTTQSIFMFVRVTFGDCARFSQDHVREFGERADVRIRKFLILRKWRAGVKDFGFVPPRLARQETPAAESAS